MENTKNIYEEPKIQLISFNAGDVINTSGGDEREVAELEEIED